MSTEQAQDTEAPAEVSTETNDNAEQATEQQTNGKPAGYYPVDFDGVPEDKAKAMRERYDYFFRQHKEMERKDKAREEALRQYREIAAEQDRQLKDLTNGVGSIVDHLEARTIGENEEDVKKSMKQAFESGDMDKFINEQARLAEIQAKKAAQKPRKVQEKQRENIRQNAGFNSAEQLAQEASTEGELAPEQVTVVAQWQDETDTGGSPLRPWARTDNIYDPDPDFVKAQLVAKRVFTMYPNRAIEENLKEVDRQMGVKQPQGKQTVMGGGLSTPQKTNRIALTPEMQKLAVRTKFGGSKAKTDAEHIEAYRKQIESVRSKQRSR